MSKTVIKHLVSHQIDFSGLEREITAKLGVKDLKLTGEIYQHPRSEKLHVRFESNELRNQVGIMYHTFKSVTISNFSTSWVEEQNCFWISVHFHYVHISGGTNGSDLFDSYYYPETKTWEFKNHH